MLWTIIPANFSKCPWGFCMQDGCHSPKEPSRGPSNTFLCCFFASSVFHKHRMIVKLTVLFKIVDKIALSKFKFGSLHGGNPLQIVTLAGMDHECLLKVK